MVFDQTSKRNRNHLSDYYGNPIRKSIKRKTKNIKTAQIVKQQNRKVIFEGVDQTLEKRPDSYGLTHANIFRKNKLISKQKLN